MPAIEVSRHRISYSFKFELSRLYYSDVRELYKRAGKLKNFIFHGCVSTMKYCSKGGVKIRSVFFSIMYITMVRREISMEKARTMCERQVDRARLG